MSLNHRRVSGAAWRRLRRSALDRDRWRCCRCESPRDLEMHHLMSLDKGGDALDLANVAMLCASCHIDSHRTIDDPERSKWMAVIRKGEL